VFVGTSGGLGTIKVASAEQDGDVITFTFSSYVGPGSTTLFFGLAANSTPASVSAGVFGIGSPPYVAVDARGPTH
jgi:hypothetical protein